MQEIWYLVGNADTQANKCRVVGALMGWSQHYLGRPLGLKLLVRDIYNNLGEQQFTKAERVGL